MIALIARENSSTNYALVQFFNFTDADAAKSFWHGRIVVTPQSIAAIHVAFKDPCDPKKALHSKRVFIGQVMRQSKHALTAVRTRDHSDTAYCHVAFRATSRHLRAFKTMRVEMIFLVSQVLKRRNQCYLTQVCMS